MKKKLQLITKAVILFSILTFGFFTSRAATADATRLLYPAYFNYNTGVENPEFALRGGGDGTIASFDNTYDQITYTNFDIPAMPSAFTIKGIAVHFIGRTTGTRQLKVDCTWNGGTNFSPIPPTLYVTDFSTDNPDFGYVGIGGSEDLWGRIAWTSDELSNANFGIRLTANDGDGVVELDEIYIAVYYVVPEGYCNGSAVFAYGNINVDNSQNATGKPNGNFAVLNLDGILEMDLTGGNVLYIPASTKVKVWWKKTNVDDNDVSVYVSETKSFTSIQHPIGWFTVNSSALTEQLIPIAYETRYLIFNYSSSSLSIDAVTYNCESCINCAPTVIVENFCGYSVLTAYDYTGTLTWSTGETTKSIQVTVEGTYTVTQTVDGNISEPGSGVAEPKVLPDVPGPVSGPAEPCEGTQVLYSVSPVYGATVYQWYVPETWEILEGQGTSQILVLTGPTYDAEEDAVSVNVRNDECMNPENSYMNVISKTVPDQPGAITGPQNTCEKTEVVYSIGPVTGATGYIWSVPEGWSITAGENTENIIVTVGTNAGDIKVKAKNDYCESEESVLSVTPDLLCCTPGEPDKYEPNNTMQTAAQITVGDPAIYANILDSKDADWFSFVTGDAGLYTLNYVPGSTAETMALYNSSARKLKPTNRTGTTYSLWGNTTYYIKLSAKLRSPAPCYSLGVEMISAALFAGEQFDDLKSAEIETTPEGICKIWPNPTKNEFSFYNGTEFPVQLLITDLTGRTIEIIKNTGVSETVRFGENYISGLYFVETTGGGTRTIFKIVKQ